MGAARKEHTDALGRFFPVIPVVLGLVAHLDAITNPFVYDDRATIVNNVSLRSLAHLGAVLAHDPHRPLVNLSYALDYALWGLSPIGFHLTSLALHLLNVFLVYRLVGRALRDGHGEDPRWRPAQLLASSLFAVHPLLTEAVGYTSGRSGVLCTTFAIGSLLAMRRGLVDQRPRFVALAIGLMLLGILSKEPAATLPFVFLAYDRLLLRGDLRASKRRLWRIHLPLIGVFVVAGAARLASFALLELSSIRPLKTHLLTQLPVTWRYLGLFVAPLNLSLAHSVREIDSPLDGVALLSLAAMIAVAVWLFRARRALPEVAFGAVWFALLLSPSSLIPLAEHMSEHRVYEASAGLFLVAAAGWTRLRMPVRVRRFAPAVAVAALLLVSMQRNRAWAHPITIWEDAVRNAPDLWTAHYALANEYQYDGRCDDALPEYQRSIQLKATQRAVVNVGTCLAQLGRIDEAEGLFQTALRIGPGVDPYFNLGLLALQRAQPAAARDYFRKVLTLDAAHVPARMALVDLYETALPDPAEVHRLCLEIQKLAPATEGLARCLP